MSRWRALAAAHDVADADLRDRLADAIETLHVVADALHRVHDDVSCEKADEASILEAIGELASIADTAREEADDAIAEANEKKAEGEKSIEAGAAVLRELDDLKKENLALKVDAAALRETLAAQAPMVDAYSDLLARVRSFVSLAERSGVKTRHVRAVPGEGAPTKDKAATRRKG